ncbi:cupin domain-containing protein [Halorubellus sp. PRR65]|uniref:cupin domain-containing protein n=1 Tax=Halorubellus sp. PRR65 TaxID=3098148 RepID=UPI002B259BB3|nr:cupin domain-containing protein [Halorubellus sp. PRR65]
MDKVDVDELESRLGPGSVRASLTKPLGLANLGANHYELAPGERLAFGVHAHEHQEEVFVVQSGTVTFEAYPDRDAALAGSDGEDAETVVARAGEVVRAAPGEYQCGRNDDDERAVVFAVGAPRDPGDLDLLRECDACGDRTAHRIELTDDRDAILAVCERCGGETARYA